MKDGSHYVHAILLNFAEIQFFFTNIVIKKISKIKSDLGYFLAQYPKCLM